jgi:quercetin dioxygenase-like cupin family protein
MAMKIQPSSSIAKQPVLAEGARLVEIRKLITADDGSGNIAMRMFEIAPAGHTPLHTHSHEHVVFIVEGEGVLVCEGRHYPFSPEYAIFVPGSKEHQFRNTGDSTLRLLCIVPAAAG